ncbi:hypothetical protein QYE76_042394 [Lolium multiflorum]|uniref:DUF4218 domain-containing protein n=1 Tax=Lolium multiflorum TaxID=4521 RepID=A0AAD8TFI7_LOLMU|nr:hypothetical protein QYE76_042394 [Lolium multiflorum]
MAVKMAVETAVEMTPGQFPVRQGAGTETSVPRILISRWRRLWKVFSGLVFSVGVFRKSIGVRQLKMLQDEIVVILCELEIYFQPAFCDICVHLLLHCGSGGYRGKQPTWDKEDAEMVRLGKENPWHKIQDVQARNFVRSRYYLDWKTGEFITDHKDVRDFEKYLDEELTKASCTAGPSSQGSTEPWDTPFNRATNKYKERELDKPPTSGGRVSGFGTSMKLSEYYGSDAKTRKLERRSSAKDKSEVQELKKKVESLEKLVAEKPVENTEMMNKLLDEKIRQIIPLG